MSNPSATVEYVLRAKLPPFGPLNLEGGLSEEYRTAIFADLPQGFEVHWASKDEWPIDKDGFTWVRLYLTDQRQAVAYFNTALARANEKIARMKAKAADLAAQ